MRLPEGEDQGAHRVKPELVIDAAVVASFIFFVMVVL